MEDLGGDWHGVVIMGKGSAHNDLFRDGEDRLRSELNGMNLCPHENKSIRKTVSEQLINDPMIMTF